MVDHLTVRERSWNMSRIRSKDTKPETTVRSLLHRLGFRFRLHRRDLPGYPDIVLPKHRTVVFVHGCFWHRHKGCKYASNPGTRVEFWQKKFRDNVTRDKRNLKDLKKDGWKVIVVWECELRELDHIASRLAYEIRGKEGKISY
ncbi:MAG TPA: DNA mismatch endonuclease Vsr [Verrucomicrobiales bacterium]|nr:DNA mismatch endonuclease Vsr [Verrucomicrobiales bacterium]HIL68276.1 DNA mismatch endonuclease Vsr [Verrucomicrobiota bacterium]